MSPVAPNPSGSWTGARTMLGVTLVIALAGPPCALAQRSVSLSQAVAIAQDNDPWIEGSRLREQAGLAQSVAAGQLPDPMVSLGFANLPVDSFDFNQEAMTQFKLGVIQRFPRGNSRVLKQRQLRELSAQHPYRREDRRARVRALVSQLWLDVYRYRQSIRLIESDRHLFEHLVDVAQSSYQSALGGTRQQDLVRAQLELTRLDDRLTTLQQQQETARAELDEWLAGMVPADWTVTNSLPPLAPGKPHLIGRPLTSQQSSALLLRHPLIKGLDQQITASSTGVSLARQQYKPQWGLNASYGYRQDDPQGIERSDFLSMGVSFDLPLFTSNRQDQQVQAELASQEALKTDRVLALRSLQSGLDVASARLQRLQQRKALYDERLLEQIHEQAEASLTAYTRDDGDFAEVVRARIAELNANIDFLNIKIDLLKTLAELQYFLAATALESGHKPGPEVNP